MDVIPQLLGRLSRRNTIKELGSVQEPPKCAYDAGLGGGQVRAKTRHSTNFSFAGCSSSKARDGLSVQPLAAACVTPLLPLPLLRSTLRVSLHALGLGGRAPRRCIGSLRRQGRARPRALCCCPAPICSTTAPPPPNSAAAVELDPTRTRPQLNPNPTHTPAPAQGVPRRRRRL